MLRWLTSGDLKASVMACVGDLQAILQTAREGGTYTVNARLEENVAVCYKCNKEVKYSGGTTH